ncbi:copper resistance protein C [Acrocarpospora phusangensis]|uniref:Copper resistance protein C n=1 Tax=Acrocarpospora phusangensis TaxID=1070424 RepID=A0A919QIH6_9ACTN|nr:copper resistance CopC family protein [Acrocarpospora phusangensis]GIH26817.1 copper resistance protein C [Acrocarpospora phusangensis]
MRRLLTVLLLASTATLAVPLSAAQAHNILLGSNPSKGSNLTTAPTEVRLTFDQPVRVEFAKLALTDANGVHYVSGPITVEKNDVVAPVKPLTAPGSYTIGYQILSNDGHPVTGQIPFTFTPTGAATTPAPTQSAAAPASSGATLPSGGGTWVWFLLAGTAALLALTVRALARHDRQARGAA